MIWFILLGGLFLIALTGVPIGIGLALVGFAILEVYTSGLLVLAVTSVWNTFTDFTLSAIPLFILLGEVLLASGISTKLYNAIGPIFERVPGRLLHTNIAVCAIFGAVNGASMSTAAAVGSVAYPELARRGYNKPAVVGTLAAGGTLGILIPPSLSLIIYGAATGVSIGKLLLAGLVPGIMMALLFMTFILVQSLRHADQTPASTSMLSTAEKIRLVLTIWPIVILISVIMGSIYFGFATPTESAGLGSAVAVLMGFFWGDLTWRKLWDSIISATFTFASIAVVVLGALVLAQSLSIIGLPMQVMSIIGQLQLSPYAVLVIVVLGYTVLGCFFDGISLQLMTLPIVFPVMVGLGFDPIWLGVVITMMIEIGMLTPPVGINLFVLSVITKGQVALGDAAIASMPYWLLLLFGVLLITLVPSIPLYLPSAMY